MRRRLAIVLLLITLVTGSIGAVAPGFAQRVFAQSIQRDTPTYTPVRYEGQKTPSGVTLRRDSGAFAKDTKVECGFWGWSIWGCILLGLNYFLELFVWLASNVLWLANMFFNKVLDISVIRFNDIVKPQTGTSGVQEAWGIARNVANSALVFILLYVAAAIILQLSSVGGKRLVVKVIIIALLINFSAFITRLVIDASNVTANQFYSLAGREQTASVSGGPTDISTQLLKAFDKPPEDPGKFKEKATISWGTFFNILIDNLGELILLLITSIVLFAGGVMFMVRTIVLIFLIVFSPFAFLFMILPKTESYAGIWTRKLFDQAIFAPAFLFMIYLTIKVVEVSSLDPLRPTAGTQDPVNTLVFFLLVNGMMIASLIIAKSFGAAGASGAMGALKRMRGFATGALVGGAAGFAGRNILGRLGQRAAESDLMRRTQARMPTIGGALRGAATRVAGGAYGGPKGGFKKRVEEKAKAAGELKKYPELQAAYLTNLGTQARQAAYGKMSTEDRVKLGRELDKETDKERTAIIEQTPALKQTSAEAALKRRQAAQYRAAGNITEAEAAERKAAERESSLENEITQKSPRYADYKKWQGGLQTLEGRLPPSEQRKMADIREKEGRKEKDKERLKDTEREIATLKTKPSSTLTEGEQRRLFQLEERREGLEAGITQRELGDRVAGLESRPSGPAAEGGEAAGGPAPPAA